MQIRFNQQADTKATENGPSLCLETEKIQASRITSQGAPVVIEPAENRYLTLQDLLQIIQERNDDFRHILHTEGALLLRGFPVYSPDDFAEVIEALNLGTYLNYIGGDSPRIKVRKGVYTSTEAPPSVRIPLHNELSFVKYYPRNIYFFCQVEPVNGGETPIGDARKIYEAIDPEVRQRFIERELKYVARYYHKSLIMDTMNKIQKGHKNWMEVFETETKEEVERLCRECEYGCKWLRRDWVQISQERPATLNHEVTGETTWFNQAHLYDYNPKFLGLWRYIGYRLFYCRRDIRHHEIFYRDGERISRKDLYHILDVLEDQSIYFKWKQGDVLVLDNVLMMHGRAPFSGKRRVLTSLTR